jgi:hypothetical protein
VHDAQIAYLCNFLNKIPANSILNRFVHIKNTNLLYILSNEVAYLLSPADGSSLGKLDLSEGPAMAAAF